MCSSSLQHRLSLSRRKAASWVPAFIPQGFLAVLQCGLPPHALAVTAASLLALPFFLHDRLKEARFGSAHSFMVREACKLGLLCALGDAGCDLCAWVETRDLTLEGSLSITRKHRHCGLTSAIWAHVQKCRSTSNHGTIRWSTVSTRSTWGSHCTVANTVPVAGHWPALPLGPSCGFPLKTLACVLGHFVSVCCLLSSLGLHVFKPLLTLCLIDYHLLKAETL